MADVRQLSEELVGSSLLAALAHLSNLEQTPLSGNDALAMIEATIQVHAGPYSSVLSAV
jgi:hypothetical protein